MNSSLNMTSEQYQQLEVSMMKAMELGVAKAIETNVNGKITNLTNIVNSLDDKTRQHINNVTLHIEEDKAWKERAEPVITMGESAIGFGKVSMYILFVAASIGAAYAAVKSLWK